MQAQSDLTISKRWNEAKPKCVGETFQPQLTHPTQAAHRYEIYSTNIEPHVKLKCDTYIFETVDTFAQEAVF